MIPKTPFYIRVSYGLSLEDAGLANALKNIGDLLDLGYQEKFAEYFPGSGHFESFREAFVLTRFRVMERFDWNFDTELMNHDPAHTQEIRDYFETVFKPAVLATE